MKFTISVSEHFTTVQSLWLTVHHAVNTCGNGV